MSFLFRVNFYLTAVELHSVLVVVAKWVPLCVRTNGVFICVQMFSVLIMALFLIYYYY